jgi:hypothetical protein
VQEKTNTAPPAGEPAAAPDAAIERPAHRRSIFFQHEQRIRELLADGRSYRQILRMLRLHQHRSVLARWCQRQGLHSLAPSRHRRQSADKKSAPERDSAASSVSPSSPPASGPPPRSVLAEALGPEPGDEWAAFRKPTSEDKS